MLAILATGLVVFGVPTLYVAIRSREFRKFLAGAFFVSGGMQFYFYLANVSVPLVGTGLVQTPELSGIRSILHFIFFLVTFYFGFIRKPTGRGAHNRMGRPRTPPHHAANSPPSSWSTSPGSAV